jgi:hypothetical protein
LPAKRQQSGALAVGEEAEVADADEAFRKQVQQEATQELIQRQGHQFLLIVMSRVPPTKGDLAIGQRDEAMVGDGHAMGVTAEILEHIFGAAEGWFAIDHPVLAKQGSQPGSEDLGLSEECQIAREVELLVLEGGVETGHELSTEDTTQHLDGKKEASTGSNPVGVVEREPTGRDDTVDVGMKLQLLVPGMQPTEEADLGA